MADLGFDLAPLPPPAVVTTPPTSAPAQQSQPAERFASIDDPPDEDALPAHLDIQLIPDHYVPLDQIEYLRPADKLRQYAASPVTAHRVYLARSLPNILPSIVRASSFLDTLQNLYALVANTDLDVRLACAGVVGDLLAAYARRTAAPSLIAAKSSDSLVDLVHASLTALMPSSSGAPATPDPATCVSALLRTAAAPDSPTSTGILPPHLLNVAVLPLLIDTHERVAETAKDGLAAALLDRITGPRVAAAVVPWAVRLLALTPTQAVDLVDLATAEVQAAATAAAAATQAAALGSPPLQSASSSIHALPAVVTAGATSPPRTARFIDHTRAYQNGEATYTSPADLASTTPISTGGPMFPGLLATASSSIAPSADVSDNDSDDGGDPVAPSASHALMADPHVSGLLFLFMQPPVVDSGNAGSGSTSALLGNGGGPSTKQATPSPARRMDDIHAHLLHLVGDALAPFLSADDGLAIIDVLDRFANNAHAAVRGAAAIAALAAARTVPTSVVATRVVPVVGKLASDKLYTVRRRVAESLPSWIESMPSRFRTSVGRTMLERLLSDASKAVRDAMYAGLARSMVALASDEPVGVVDDYDGDVEDVVSALGPPPAQTNAAGGQLGTAGFASQPNSAQNSPRGSMIFNPSLSRSGSGAASPLPNGASTSTADPAPADGHDDDDLESQDDADTDPPLSPILAQLLDADLPPLPARSPHPDRIPPALIHTYCLTSLRWKDPDRMAKCAYSLPGLIATMPATWWTAHFKSLFAMLARDPLLDVRRPLMAGIDVIARSIPARDVTTEILPVLTTWLDRETTASHAALASKLPGILALVPSGAAVPQPLASVPLEYRAHSGWTDRHAVARTLPSWLAAFALRPRLLAVATGQDPNAVGFATVIFGSTEQLVPRAASEADRVEAAWVSLGSVLKQLVRDSVAAVRDAAGRAVAQVLVVLPTAQARQLVAFVQRLASDDGAQARAASAAAVREIACVVPGLVRDEGADEVRARAVRGMVSAVVPALVRDKVVDVRLAVAGVLAAPVLARMVDDEDDEWPAATRDEVAAAVVAAVRVLRADGARAVRDRVTDAVRRGRAAAVKQDEEDEEE
ncbi:hypothetical protein AMAG_00209 [Allomyces macrogynus ATCC 38327]|uniref:Uncharacterized protein n=1 Tax=Allomyces macrogynus (strain ATCC 38327) TaxID=578462 RepID=A0A0L0RV75_ALLM3|nr:hypothetical protein AMAG_00209 [Allomyces macrogynus ATCC 38327]|eukprot:KNE54218.1 hypothetical protein AMAG_00209 [Allomyces macrogynus ATCC 38327]